jgi:hypothetical protein
MKIQLSLNPFAGVIAEATCIKKGIDNNNVMCHCIKDCGNGLRSLTRGHDGLYKLRGPNDAANCNSRFGNPCSSFGVCCCSVDGFQGLYQGACPACNATSSTDPSKYPGSHHCDDHRP